MPIIPNRTINENSLYFKIFLLVKYKHLNILNAEKIPAKISISERLYLKSIFATSLYSNI